MIKMHGSTNYGSGAKKQPEKIFNDTERLDWLHDDPDRLEDVLGCVNNEGFSVREAIDSLINRN